MCNKNLDGAQHAEKERSWSKDAFSTIWNFKLDISSSKFMAQEEKENTTKEKNTKKKKYKKDIVSSMKGLIYIYNFSEMVLMCYRCMLKSLSKKLCIQIDPFLRTAAKTTLKILGLLTSLTILTHLWIFPTVRTLDLHNTFIFSIYVLH